MLATTPARVRQIQRELVEIRWLRHIDSEPARANRSIALDEREWAALGLVELTRAGRRHLAGWLGLTPATAARYHGLLGDGRRQAGRRRRLLRTLAHTLGANAVFVAVVDAADAVRRLGGTDRLVEWRSAAGCERQLCKPDGYGLYERDGVSYGFFLEFDRGTESTRKYAAKFRAYYRYRDSGQAARDYDGLPTILFVTTSASAEGRIAEQAYRAWFCRGTEPLRVLLTTTERINGHAEGLLGPIWRTPAGAPGDLKQRVYWLPRPAEQRRLQGGHLLPTVASVAWTTRVPSRLPVELARQGDVPAPSHLIQRAGLVRGPGSAFIDSSSSRRRS